MNEASEHKTTAPDVGVHPVVRRHPAQIKPAQEWHFDRIHPRLGKMAEGILVQAESQKEATEKAEALRHNGDRCRLVLRGCPQCGSLKWKPRAGADFAGEMVCWSCFHSEPFESSNGYAHLP